MFSVTVIVCTYNRSQFLPKALASIAASDVPGSLEWEVLVVDNNSTDGTRDIVEGFCRRYPGRFRYLFEAHQGLSFARNAGVREARGEVVAFTDDDAIVEPDWLWSLTRELDGDGWAGAGGRIVPAWEGALPSWLSTDDVFAGGPFGAFDPGHGQGQLKSAPFGGNMAFRKVIFAKHGEFRADLGRKPGNLLSGEDTEFGNRLLARGEFLRYEPEAVVRHRLPENRLQKRYVLSWWFWKARTDIALQGVPSDARWLVAGVPVHLFRRLARWTLQWGFTFGARPRFLCRRGVWFVAGQIKECCRQSRSHAKAGLQL